jgi:hypothetical protein
MYNNSLKRGFFKDDGVVLNHKTGRFSRVKTLSKNPRKRTARKTNKKAKKTKAKKTKAKKTKANKTRKTKKAKK